jgi:predicted aspartyl protease
MQKALSPFILILGVNLIPFPAEAQEQPGCFMRGANGQPIDLGHLCRNNSSTSTVATSGIFQVPIKRREGGIPVIEVMFNGKQHFEMLLDTGATATVINPQMAQALAVKVEGTIPIGTAGGVVQAGVGRVVSAQAGGVTIKNLAVVISSSLPMGLLGQNFFGNHDVTIKANVIEFRIR